MEEENFKEVEIEHDKDLDFLLDQVIKADNKKEYQKKYRASHPDYYKRKVTCPLCGTTHRYAGKWQHEQSANHKKHLNGN